MDEEGSEAVKVGVLELELGPGSGGATDAEEDVSAGLEDAEDEGVGLEGGGPVSVELVETPLAGSCRDAGALPLRRTALHPLPSPVRLVDDHARPLQAAPPLPTHPQLLRT